MSHIFEALQKSSFGQPDPFSTPIEPAAEVFHGAEQNEEKTLDIPSVTTMPRPESRLIALTQQESLAAEKFRFLAVRLRHLQASRGLKRLLITSTIPEEGKSLVAANLAFTLARRQPKILLLDGDLRHSSLSATLGVGENHEGLSELLQNGRHELDNTLRLDETGPYFMPAGSPPENPLELMQLPRFGQLLEQLSHMFDWIIIDSPPVLPLADTTVWAKFSDGVLLVTREGKTEKKQLTRGIEALGTTKLLGTVLNNCSTVDHGYYYSRYQSAHPAPPAKTNGEKKT